MLNDFDSNIKFSEMGSSDKEEIDSDIAGFSKCAGDFWHFTLDLIKINYGQIGDQTGLFYTTNPVFYTSGNRSVRHTGTFGNL
jgi:hypothetical protein